MSGICALGDNWPDIFNGLKAKQNCVQRMPWDDIQGLHTRLGAPITDFSTPKHYPRKMLRSMGRVAVMSVRATEMALENAGLLDDDVVKSGAMGVSYGSCIGTPGDVPVLSQVLSEGSTLGLNSGTYLKVMSHTAPVNIGLFFGMKGRIIPTTSACTSGSQGIGYAYEAIKYGQQDLMVAGGSEEFCLTQVSVFDVMFATSTRNDDPKLTPRPFDANRDGLVLGEGACSIILEEYEHAKARGATIYGEVVGYGTNSDGQHVTEPSANTMGIAMELALKDAGVSASDIGYVNAHGTATGKGDIAETNATARVLGAGKPISSLKSYLGHTLGACGALEFWMSLEMMRNNWFAPTINLENVDPECGDLDYIVGDGREMDHEFVMTNNFAFGGINTSLIIKRM
ncbi:beta-ketoacyl-ACP synthase [Teredinibacter sp. KSP-S5-2]|uniref:beta-ketoacyl-ACP synthase n=1 Tax=Teredinibacter sp. KSP-S5-2 TaxID=3034506 RepID=UPI002B2CC922|nr:beta-ketoacyl-ACP synthase [Teredinibacter sp. KSP-S5-2]